MKDSKINYEKKSIPSSPGAAQITTTADGAKKGSGAMNSKLPTEHVVKDGSKK